MTDKGIGAEAHRLIERLYPINRSLTGDGVRASLAIVREHAPFEVHEVATGTPVLDWTVPQEWNVREAWIAGPDGRRLVDVDDHSLHLMGYSVPFRGRMPLGELREHLHTLPDQSDRIPYRTSYYAARWGFCLRHADLESWPDGVYEVCVDTTLADGHLTYGELVLPGRDRDEVLLHAHVCHPSLANDNLSSVALVTLMARELAQRPHRLSYRIVLLPGTIGAITWLARTEATVRDITAGLVLAGTGDAGPVTYKRSRQGAATVDRAVELVLRESGAPHAIEEFSPWGYDERQYGSPGFDLPVGCLMRTPHGRYPEYHTSGDDLTLVRPAALADTYEVLRGVLAVLEGEARYRNLSPKGEPQLGRRGLYGSLGGAADKREAELALLWVLNQSDGHAALLDIAERSGVPFAQLRHAADVLLDHDLLAPSSG